MNYKVCVTYNGSNYYGWSVQPDKITIQSVLKNIINDLFKVDVIINSSGRTDAKVHALNQIINIKHKDINIPSNEFTKALNSRLPNDIHIKYSEIVDEEFHARYSCKSKIYMYLINTRDEYDAINQNVIYQYNKSIDIECIKRELIPLFLGKKDFLSFSTSSLENTIREIKSIVINNENGIIKIFIEGKGFLRSMVRMIVGTFLSFNEGKVSIDKIEDCFNNPRKGKSLYKSPGCGLYLYKVYY